MTWKFGKLLQPRNHKIIKAKKMKIHTIGLLGQRGGKVKKDIINPLVVKSNNVARIQESHIFLGHIILEQVEKLLLKK